MPQTPADEPGRGGHCRTEVCFARPPPAGPFRGKTRRFRTPLSERTDAVTDRQQKLQEFLRDKPEDPFLNYGLAEAMASDGDTAAAVERLDLLLGFAPDYVPAYLRKGMFLVELDRQDEARTTLEAGIPIATAAGEDHAAAEMQGVLDTLDD